jgi:hypothetical protein
LPASVSDTAEATVSSLWLLFSTWALGLAFWKVRDRCETRAVREYIEARNTMGEGH